MRAPAEGGMRWLETGFTALGEEFEYFKNLLVVLVEADQGLTGRFFSGPRIVKQIYSLYHWRVRHTPTNAKDALSGLQAFAAKKFLWNFFSSLFFYN